jgi:hypothetical protein
MSVLAILIPLVIAVIATLVRAAILGDWDSRSLAAHFCFALCLLLLPGVVHP